VGLPLELPELTNLQIADLVHRHQLNWQSSEVAQLMALTGGHPYLVRRALYQIARGRIDLQKLLQLASTEDGIYGDHLRRQLGILKEDDEMMEAFREVVASDRPLQLESSLAFRLRSIGLVKFQGNQVIPMCDLYYQYFRESIVNDVRRK
jgi:serine/threonine-protein kinase